MPSRRTALATFVAAGIGAACRAGRQFGAGARLTLDDIGERYVRITLKLALHQPSLVETWLGADDWRPGGRRPVTEIREEVAAVNAALAEMMPASEEGSRYRYLRGQLNALALAGRRLAGESMPFWDEARAALGDEEADAARTALPGDVTDAREELDRLLPGRGPVHQRCAAFRRGHALSPERRTPTIRAAIHVCRDRVWRHVSLPGAETVELKAATGLGVEARAVYRGGFGTQVSIDTSGPSDLARLVWLVAHETYAGHHLQNVLADRDCVQARGWHERALHPAFGRHLLYAEGAAEAGAALLLDGSAFEEICRELAPVAGIAMESLTALVAVHRAVAALDAVIPDVAQQYLDGEIGSDAAVERLTVEALVANARPFLGVIERQRTRLLGYPLGRRLVSADLRREPVEGRWQLLAARATMLESGTVLPRAEPREIARGGAPASTCAPDGADSRVASAATPQMRH